MKKSVELGAVQETLLIPLLSRAQETARPNGLLKDPRAVEIVDQLDYDFDKWRGIPLSSACVRTRMFDEIAQGFLASHPEGTIVEIGCGLNTRFERIDNGRARWFDLDLPDSIDLRRSFFDDHARRTMIAGDVFDEAWMEPVMEAGQPALFLSEAVLIYFEESQVKQVIGQIATTFPGARLVTDTCASKLTAPKAQEKAMKRFGVRSWFEWACDDPRSIEQWHPGIELIDSRTIAEASPDIVAGFPTVWRTLTRLMPALVRYLTKDYQIAHFRMGGA